MLSHVRLFATQWTVAHQAPMSMGFFQARILEWVAIFFSRASSLPRDQTRISCISCIGRQILYHSANTEIKLLIVFVAEDAEAVHIQEKQNLELTVTQIISFWQQKSDLNKIK